METGLFAPLYIFLYMLESLVVILAASAVPAIIYVIWVRGWEVCNREELGDLYRALAIGATYAVALAVIVSTAFNALFFGIFRAVISAPIEMHADLALLFSVLVVAPAVEESIKLSGFRFIAGKIRELEDGLIYGMAIGFGFALTENAIYGWEQYLSGGIEAGLALVAVRSALSSFLHASSTAIAGYGISRSLVNGSGSVLPYLGAAILLHATFNFLSSSSIFFGSTVATWLLTLMLVPLVYLVVVMIRRYAGYLDRREPCHG